MSTGINVIYDKLTRRVIVYQEGDTWVLPSHMELAHYEPGAEPVLVDTKDGDTYLKPNAVIITDL